MPRRFRFYDFDVFDRPFTDGGPLDAAAEARLREELRRRVDRAAEEWMRAKAGANPEREDRQGSDRWSDPRTPAQCFFLRADYLSVSEEPMVAVAAAQARAARGTAGEAEAFAKLTRRIHRALAA